MAPSTRKSSSMRAVSACCEPIGSDSFDRDSAADLSKGFAALADPVRLHLFSIIAAEKSGGVCVCDLIGPSGKSQPTVSHHLRVLREAGLVVSERRGTWVWYSVVPSTRQKLRDALA